MNVNTNQTVQYGSNVQLNCFAQYYSEKVISKKESFKMDSIFIYSKAMDSPYLPRILWFFERKQLFHDSKFKSDS